MCYRVTKGKICESQVRDHVVHLGLNVSNSAHNYKIINIIHS